MAALALNTTGLVAARLPRKASRGTTGRRSLVTRAAGADDDEKPTARSVLSFLCPLLKVFGGGDAAAPRNRTLEVATSGFASIARLPFGSKVDEACIARPAGAVPKEPIILYEFEACPFCRRVREALSQLDLTVEVRPCPKDAVKHRTEVEAMGGKLTFPFLVDPNTEAGKGGMYESEDICRYLYATYGNGAEFPEGIISTTVLTGWMPTLLRAGRGMTRYANATTHGGADLKPLTLYQLRRKSIRSAGAGGPVRAGAAVHTLQLRERVTEAGDADGCGRGRCERAVLSGPEHRAERGRERGDRSLPLQDVRRSRVSTLESSSGNHPWM